MRIELKVSRTPIRMAVSKLEQEGLVFHRPGRGYFIRHIRVPKKEIEFALGPHPMFAGCISGSPSRNCLSKSLKAATNLCPAFACYSRRAIHRATSRLPCQQPWVPDRVPGVVPPGIHTDMLQAYESMLRVKNVADVIIPFHDPFSPAQMQITEKKPYHCGVSIWL